jgi:hypothetical protein
MATPTATDWPATQPLSDSTMSLMDLIPTLELITIITAAVIFVAASSWLVARTRVPGRLFILSGIVAFVLPLLFAHNTMYTDGGLQAAVWMVAIGKLVPPIAAVLCALGFARVVWHVYRREK